MKNIYLKLARDALKYYLETGKTLALPNDCPQKLKDKKAGIFVSYHNYSYAAPRGPLRGCIGTFLPTCDSLAQEIINNAIAASRDPRFMPVNLDELDDLKIKVDVLSPPQKTEAKNLDPKVYGVIVKSRDGRKGLLLPDLEGVETVEQQIEICRQKAGISPDEPIELYRFTVERHEEK